MASTTACFANNLVPKTTERFKAWQRGSERIRIVCRAQRKVVDQYYQEQSNDGGEVAIISRRLATSLLIGSAAAATSSNVSPAEAAYGEAANVFGKPKKNTDFLPYDGDGFKVLIPSKWNPSKEVEYPGQVLRYEDNFDSTSNLAVIVIPTDKKSITDFGSPEQFLSQVDFLLGRQAYFGKTYSEGGFDPDSVATANILETSMPEVDGKKYYYLSILTRTADGDEGGKHQLIRATVSDGKLYICKAQAGDKRWFKGARRFVENAATSFKVA